MLNFVNNNSNIPSRIKKRIHIGFSFLYGNIYFFNAADAFSKAGIIRLQKLEASIIPADSDKRWGLVFENSMPLIKTPPAPRAVPIMGRSSAETKSNILNPHKNRCVQLSAHCHYI